MPIYSDNMVEYTSWGKDPPKGKIHFNTRIGLHAFLKQRWPFYKHKILMYLLSKKIIAGWFELTFTTINEVAETFSIHKAQASTILNNMARSGHLRVFKHKRPYQFMLTGQGIDYANYIWINHKTYRIDFEFYAKKFKYLSESDFPLYEDYIEIDEFASEKERFLELVKAKDDYFEEKELASIPLIEIEMVQQDYLKKEEDDQIKFLRELVKIITENKNE